jgi:GNAT superfamily N-acetyltransferase
MTEGLAIRRLEADEPAADLIARWRHDAFFADTGTTFEATMESQRQWLAQWSDHETALIAEVAGKPAGCCLFVREEIDAKHDLTPWLASLYVAPAFRKRGVGGALVRAIEQHGRGAGCRALHLYTVSAESFYAKLGWITRERFDWHGEPMILMVRAL